MGVGVGGRGDFKGGEEKLVPLCQNKSISLCSGMFQCLHMILNSLQTHKVVSPNKSKSNRRR